MLEPVLVRPAARLEYLGPIEGQAAPLGPVGQVLDSVDILLAGTLECLFGLFKR